MVSTSDFGSRNVLRALGVFRVGWDKLGCGFFGYLQKIGILLGFLKV